MQTTRVSPKKIPVDNVTAYKNFNLGLHVGDCVEQVEKNRQYLQELLPLKTRIQWLEQVHGDTVVNIQRVTKQPIVADAMVTREKNIALAIMTADCLPILLVSSNGDEIAAIHGGWRPLGANIITNTVSKMHAAAGEIYAWLGPCIGKKVFEVGYDVQKVFAEKDDIFSQAFCKQDNGKYLADLHKIATIQLNQLGITKISHLSECTYSEPEKYYSYRKASTTGRMASVITLL
jgi:YfiH family protein